MRNAAHISRLWRNQLDTSLSVRIIAPCKSGRETKSFAGKQGSLFLALLLPLAINAAPQPTDEATERQFDLVCTTIMDTVEGTLADGSPVVAAAIGETRRYSMDLDAMRYSSGSKVNQIHAIEGTTVTKEDPDEVKSFGGVVHMQSDWTLDLATGLSIKRNLFFSDGQRSRTTGRSEWHQQCERAPFSGPADS